MANELDHVLRAACGVAFTLDVGNPRLLRRREDDLFTTLVAWRVAERESMRESVTVLCTLAGCPGSLGLACAMIRRRCRG